ncbi:MAG: type ISP restriction/modification enzyme [Francisella endosymbiont of Hyalomma asiaticum]
MEKFLRLDDKESRAKFHLGKDVWDCKVSYARADLEANYQKEVVFTEVVYRPFDKKWTFYIGKSKGFHYFTINDTIKHMLKGEDVCIAVRKDRDKLLALKIGTLYR